MNNIEEKIRQICTHHSDEGTSGYNLSEEQFERLFDLFLGTIEEELTFLLKNGHGGGNFRRLIEQKLKAKEMKGGVK